MNLEQLQLDKTTLSREIETLVSAFVEKYGCAIDLTVEDFTTMFTNNLEKKHHYSVYITAKF